MSLIVVLRGGGDLASGAALRLHRAGLRVLVAELTQPLVVRRRVAFAEAVYQGETRVEGVTARLVAGLEQAQGCFARGEIPVLIDPQAQVLQGLQDASSQGVPTVLVDGRMIKQAPELGLGAATLVVGLGPGFVAGENCHAVVETNRGHRLGRVIWKGAPEADTGSPEQVNDRDQERVLRAPADGRL